MSLFATVAYDEDAKDYIVKIANTSDSAQDIKLDFKEGYKGEILEDDSGDAAR